MNAESIVPICFGLLFPGAITWLIMVSALFRRLKRDHPEKFHAMGEPGLILNNTPRTSWTLLRFLFKREDRPLNDPSLSRLSKIMLVFFVCYCIAFFGLLAARIEAAPMHHRP